jgi:hypothetical protein
MNEFDINNFDINDVSKKKEYNKNKPSSDSNLNNVKLNKLDPSYNENKLTDFNKDENKHFENINENIPIKVIKSNDRKSQVLEKDIKKIEELVGKNIKQIDTSKFHKKLDFELPVKFKTPNYYRLSVLIGKLMSNAKKDIEANDLDKAKGNLELANYYMTKVIK